MLTFHALSVRHTYFPFITFTSIEIYSIDTYARCTVYGKLVFFLWFSCRRKTNAFPLLTNTRITVVNHSIIQRMHLEHVRSIRYIQCIQITQFCYCKFSICINPISLKNTLSKQITYFRFAWYVGFFPRIPRFFRCWH